MTEFSTNRRLNMHWSNFIINILTTQIHDSSSPIGYFVTMNFVPRSKNVGPQILFSY